MACRSSFWKINSSLLNDPSYVQMIREKLPEWTNKIQFCDDLRVVWHRLKYNIRKESISYSKTKAHERREKIKTIEQKLQFYENQVCQQPTRENLHG